MYYWEFPDSAIRAKPDTAAVIGEGGRFTWRELGERRDRVAAGLEQAGVRVGAAVGVLLHNSAFHPELFFGISRAGCVVVPLNWRLPARELAEVIETAGVSAVFADSSLAQSLDGSAVEVIPMGGPGDWSDYERWLARAPESRPARTTDEGDPTFIGFSSGSSGRQKGVVHTHRSLVESGWRLLVEMRLRHEDVFLTCMPLFFALAQSPLMVPIMRGCTVVITDFSTTTAIDAIDEHRVTATVAVPTMLRDILESGAIEHADVGSLRQWVYAGSPAPRDLVEACFNRFGPVLTQCYGLTESGLIGSTLSQEDHVLAASGRPELFRSAGRVQLGVDLRVLDLESGEAVPCDGESAGEICLGGPFLMKEYAGAPDLTADAVRDGLLHTGDIATIDSDGYLQIVDRMTDMIITGGINVYPSRVEQALRSSDAVADVVVVGGPSERWGEQITAFLRLQPTAAAGAQDVTALLEPALRELPDYMRPKDYRVVDDFPKLGSGKVDKRTLRRSLWPQPDPQT